MPATVADADLLVTSPPFTEFMESHIGRLPKQSMQGRWRGKRFEGESD